MLKFIKDNMTTIDGIEIFPLISFLIFFTFFLGMGWYVWTMKKSKIEALGNLPLEENELS